MLYVNLRIFIIRTRMVSKYHCDRIEGRHLRSPLLFYTAMKKKVNYFTLITAIALYMNI